MLEILKKTSIKKIIAFLTFSIIIGFMINLYAEPIFHLPNEKVKGFNEQSAIIYIWGHRYFSQMEDFDPCGLITSEIDEIERQCALSELEMLKEVQEKWGWDMYFYYGIKPIFRRHQYDTLLIIFSGHGKYENGHQFFTFNADKVVEVEKISRGISCKNLTVIVSSCFSLNWQSEFQHDSLTKMFTSDLCNSTTGGAPYPFCSTEIEYYISFSRTFLMNLYNGLNYYNANKTTFEWYYSTFPTYNCSQYLEV